jgi:hypothetical protein
MALSKQDLLAPKAFRARLVEVGDFGQVYMREMSVAQSIALGKRQDSGDTEENIRASLGMVVSLLCDDEGGTPMFAVEERDGAVDALLGKGLSEAKAFIDACLSVNGLSAEAIKADVGNSAAVPS